MSFYAPALDFRSRRLSRDRPRIHESARAYDDRGHLPGDSLYLQKPVSTRKRQIRGAELARYVAAVRRAEIPVERIRAPLLMFSGKDDQLWPSDVFAARVVERLKEHKFAYPVEHYSYEHAGHAITRPYVPTSDVREVRIHPVSKRPNIVGGTPEGQARANEDSWSRLLSFLDKYLRNESDASVR